MNVSGKKRGFAGNSPRESIAFPIILLILLMSIYFAVGCRDVLSEDGLRYFLSRWTVLGIITMGAVFIFSVGAFGISIGSSVLVSISVGALVYSYTQSLILTFLSCIVIGLVNSVLSSILGTVFNLPAYVTAALMLSLFGAIAQFLFNLAEGGIIYTGLGEGVFYSFEARLFIFGVFFVLCVVLYKLTPIGNRQKMLGDNPECARRLGLSRRLYSLIGFGVAGCAVGIGAFLILNSYPSVDQWSIGDLGINIILAVILGGMPLSGGARSKLSSAVLGSFSAILISDILEHLLYDKMSFLGLSQIIRALILMLFMCIIKDRARERGHG